MDRVYTAGILTADARGRHRPFPAPRIDPAVLRHDWQRQHVVHSLPMLAAFALAATAYAHPEQLVETDWLAAHAADADVRVVDMRNAAAAFDAGHVPGAVYLAPVAIRDANRPPTFLPAPGEFEAL